ncbi:hypothetical protein BJ166DRAFT_599590 [Pestalotiopsis sp. NC0098]|nr:hypothetical protein BJ166DRAFT_599590 [Pestalotiopsis sp. NC0098]
MQQKSGSRPSSYALVQPRYVTTSLKDVTASLWPQYWAGGVELPNLRPPRPYDDYEMSVSAAIENLHGPAAAQTWKTRGEGKLAAPDLLGAKQVKQSYDVPQEHEVRRQEQEENRRREQKRMLRQEQEENRRREQKRMLRREQERMRRREREEEEIRQKEKEIRRREHKEIRRREKEEKIRQQEQEEYLRREQERINRQVREEKEIRRQEQREKGKGPARVQELRHTSAREKDWAFINLRRQTALEEFCELGRRARAAMSPYPRAGEEERQRDLAENGHLWSFDQADLLEFPHDFQFCKHCDDTEHVVVSSSKYREVLARCQPRPPALYTWNRHGERETWVVRFSLKHMRVMVFNSAGLRVKTSALANHFANPDADDNGVGVALDFLDRHRKLFW